MTSMLSAEELNDFIRPSAVCTKPVESGESEQHLQLEVEGGDDGDGDSDDGESKTATKTLSRAQISLTDCLACSGCVTSSEEVLLSQHTYEEFVKRHRENEGEKFVLSVADQCRASLANAYGVSVGRVDGVLARVFGKILKFTSVVPLGVAREAVHEAIWEEVKGRDGPLLSGACPGWLVYASKTQPELGPMLSRVKSPMGVVGSMLKAVYGTEIYHLSVMPCFDKKLEASAEDDVDMVITPRELVPLLAEYGVDLAEEMDNDGEDKDDWLRKMTPRGWSGRVSEQSWGESLSTLSNPSLTSSGGFALRYCERLLREHKDEHAKVDVVAGRNADVCELRVVAANGAVIGRAGVVNGFKNIQNLVRKLSGDKKDKGRGTTRRRVVRKRGITEGTDAATTTTTTTATTIDLSQCSVIEVNACPGGCVNGGGLIAPPEGATTAEWLARVRVSYRETEVEKGASCPEEVLSATEGVLSATEDVLSALTARTSLLPQTSAPPETSNPPELAAAW